MMKFQPLLFVALLLPLMAVAGDTTTDQEAVANVIDDFHDAAAHGDNERYLSHLTSVTRACLTCRVWSETSRARCLGLDV